MAKSKKQSPPAPMLFEVEAVKQVHEIHDNQKHSEKSKLDISKLGLNAIWTEFGKYIKKISKTY